MSKKKRGRPLNPSSASKQTPPSVIKLTSDPLDFSLINDSLLNLQGFDALTSKQASDLLKNLDAIKEKLKGKQTTSVDDETVPETQLVQEKKGAETNKNDPPRKASIWDNFDISKLRNAGGKLEFHKPLIKEGTAIEEAKAKDIEAKYAAAVECSTPKHTSQSDPLENEQLHSEIWRRGGFKYFNMWAADADFKQLVQEAWDVDIDGYHMYRFTRKLRRVREVLSQFNKEKFDSIDKKEIILRAQLDEVQKKLQDDPANAVIQRQERAIFHLYRDIEIRNNKLEMQSVNQRSLIIELDKLLEPLSIPSELCLRVVNYRSLSLVNLLSLEFNLMMFQWVQYSACLTGDSFDEPKKLQNVCEWLISAMQGLDVPNIDPTFAKTRAVKEKRGELQILKSTFVRKASEFLRNYFASFTEFMMNDKSYFSQQGQLKSPDHADLRFNCRTYAGLLQYLKVVWMNYNLCSRADGEHEFLFFRNPSADMLLHESELDIKLIKQAKIFHYGSISLIDEPCKSAHLAALRIAKDSGCILSYDPNLRLALWPSAEAARDGIMSIWDEADVIQISEDEITFLTGGDDPYDDNVVLTKLFHPNLKLLIVTEGSEGCRYYTKVKFQGHLIMMSVV
ncbi:hypothetical protein RIF29_08976 [Crotalaria pallida]|uniref:Carbohydrate kinase PfkB domain-containing protein n=1 Tax=Crotalaria pallida TaxID=3830 RepID=A0AAN9FRH2_CROPI